MEWLKQHWWFILIIIVGMFINAIKDLNRVDFKSYLDKRKPKSQKLPPTEPSKHIQKNLNKDDSDL